MGSKMSVRSIWSALVDSQERRQRPLRASNIRARAGFAARQEYAKNLLKQRNQAAISIQSYCRRHLAIKKLKFLKENNAATVIQTMWRTRFAKKEYVNLKSKTIIIQSYFRMWSARKTYQTTMNRRSEAAIVVQKCFRTFLAQKKLKCLRENKAATTIQAFWRCHSLRRKFSTLKNKTIFPRDIEFLDFKRS